MSEAILESPCEYDYPVAMFPEYIAQSTTTIIVRQDRKRDFTCFDSKSGGGVLFHVTGKVKSYSKRCDFIDANTGTSLFQLRKRYLNVREKYYLEFPNSDKTRFLSAAGGQDRVFSTDLLWDAWLNFNVTLKNVISGEQIILEVHAQSVSGSRYDVALDGRAVLKIRKIGGRKTSSASADSGDNRPAWKVDVPKGMDVSIALTIAVILTDLHSGKP
ncbi:hypothetical protein BDV97DRAFT_412382 [Delphinella strobiligena]|nr:hypothetical protein BDV97DRAFT_412382 [Delphinella strobiligena]